MKAAPFAFKACLAGLLLLAIPTARGASLLETMDREVSALYQQSRDAVVKVHSQRDAGIGPARRVGTGFFVDTDGRLLTSATVVDGAIATWVEWQGKLIPAKIIGRDPITNLAVLQVDPAKCTVTGKGTPFLVTGNSDELKVGSMVIAIGFPFDQPSTPSVGFVNGFDIKAGNHTFVTSHIRAGCRLRPGQGGGPVLNAQGAVVGISIAAHQDDQCYVLPMRAATRVLEDIKQSGTTQYGWVGLSVVERQNTVLVSTTGQWQVFVQGIDSNTPAANAGFRDRDILVRIHTNEICRSAQVLDTMFRYRAGDKLQFTVLRDGRPQELTLVIGQRPPAEKDNSAPPLPATPRLNLVPVSASPGK
jgi:S1-C subfamily serine protease